MSESKKHTESARSNPVPWVIGAVLMLGLAAAAGIYWNQTSKVERIRFKGFHFVTKNELQKHLDIPVGINPDSLDEPAIRKKLQKIPYVKYARLNMTPGGTLVIAITERKPIALLEHDGKYAYVDSAGIRLQQKPGKACNVPILYGFQSLPLKDTLQSNAFRITSHFLQDLRNRKAADATVSEVLWQKKKGIIALTNNNGVKLIFGKGHFDKRLRNWQAFYRQVVRKQGIASIHSVDLRFKGQIVTNEN